MFAFWLMPQHLETLGFAARNREPNEVAYYLSLGSGMLALLNLIVLLRSKQTKGVLVAGGVMVALILLDVYLYVATW
jgi:hypothetical protein